MFNFIRSHQMNIMLALCAMCGMMAVLLLITKFLPKKRKWILIIMELEATFLLGFDRMAYTYAGVSGSMAYVMVRLSNFIVFFLTAAIVFSFNFYLIDLLERVGVQRRCRRLGFVNIACVIEMLLVVANIFLGFYFYFDGQNYYHRGSGFLFCYLVPVLGPIIQFTVIQKYRKAFSRYIYAALCLYIFLPIAVGILQIFTYGISIVNMAMVLVSVSMYIFTYLDINDEVQKAHNTEMMNLKESQKGMKELFSEAVNSFVTAVEKRDVFIQGKAQKCAEIARMIAKKSKMPEEKCDEVYYAAFLHNAGIASFPDTLFESDHLYNSDALGLKNLSEISSEILKGIEEYPYLSETALYWPERYDEKGKEIPEYARIVAVADAYTKLTARTKNRNPVPMAVIREEFVKEAGLKYDPLYSNLMVQIMDAGEAGPIEEENYAIESEVSCTDYRENVSVGIPVLQSEVSVSFTAHPSENLKEGQFSAPSLVLFDSFDRRVHTDEHLMETYRYIEYGELWFDGHSISTNIRNIEIQTIEDTEEKLAEANAYQVKAGRYEDHVIILLKTFEKTIKVIAALPDIARSAYIGLTGENCLLSDIQIDYTNKFYEENDIPRIAEQISFINRIEADIPNVQINSTLSAYTEGVPLKEKLSLAFHTMSFPDSSFVWHCPYIVLYYSEDGKVGGKDYREYALVKLNGEDNGSNKYAENHFSLRKTESFKDWEYWKKENKAGIECTIEFQRQGNSITFTTVNLGIEIENTTILKNCPKEVYLSLTGDECAITDIRLR